MHLSLASWSLYAIEKSKIKGGSLFDAFHCVARTGQGDGIPFQVMQLWIYHENLLAPMS